ncbi:endogenous retrovirus group 3 member 1 [Chelydra serpentina]|uniref:Endogenous retrovirus group 3 member 1 n=1 Tax=Chelydra serpentina TaxID=8475 RepID=A0A8T1SMH0_CHESE|nr:endogenous retrovirus group 3 member 1 [Chelydra serpentina]
MGIFCLNRTRREGVYVGESKCDWTLSLGFDCYDPNCYPYNCSKYQGRWNHTHVRLTDNSWVRCSYQQPTDDGCKAVGQDGFFDALFLSCQRDNTISKDHVVRWYQWAWQHHNGTRTHFKQFWSSTSMPKFGCNCAWKTGAGTWKCDYCDSDGLPADMMGGPLGPGNHSYYEEPADPETWDGPFANGTWALKGHYWICGPYAYRRLPPNWSGVCYVGYIRPLFFLLPQIQGNKLGIKVYDDLIRERRSVDSTLAAGSSQTWGAQEWPPERIIEYYGPATWNPSELVSGAREPIYNLNRIIRLQAVLEILTNQTGAALDLLADQSTQMRNAIYQHHIVLDYLLAEEGGVCAKLNESNCCLQIDDNGKAVKQLTKEMRKLAHVPFQTWGGWNMDWFTSWLPQLGWL